MLFIFTQFSKYIVNDFGINLPKLQTKVQGRYHKTGRFCGCKSALS